MNNPYWGRTLSKIHTVLMLVLFLFSVAGCGGVAHVEVGPSAAAPPVEVLTQDPALVTGELPNGLRYVLMKNSEPRDRVSMHLNIQAGSLHETENQRGLAHFLEHMLFNGSTHFKPGELVKYFQRIGMDFGGDANAHTSYDETVYDVLLPAGSRKDLEEGLLVLRDYADGALLLEEETDRERSVILAEKRDRDSSSYRMFLSTLDFEFPDMRFTHRQPIGKEEVVKAADSALLRDYYETWYRPERMVLVMVGDFDTDVALEVIKERFSSLEARRPSRPEPHAGELDHDGIKSFYYHDREAGKTTVTIEAVSQTEPPVDSVPYRKERLIRDVGFMILNNRLEKLAGMPETPFTEASTGAAVFLKRVKYAYISAECTPEKWEEALALLDRSLRTALAFPFTETELERVRLEYLAGLASDVKAASTRDSNRLARQIIRSVNRERTVLSPQQKMELYAPALKGLTAGEVHDAFVKSWAEDHRLVLVTGNAELAAETVTPEEKILSLYEASRKVAVVKPVGERVVTFPYLPVPAEPGRIAGKEVVNDLGITVVTFENGLRLNLKRTDYKADQVLFKLSFGKGRSAEPETKPGLGVLSENVINESGLGKYDRDEIQRALAGKNTDMEFAVDEERFLLEGSSVTGETELMFQLLQTAVKEPALRMDAWTLVMERMAQNYMELERTVGGAVTRHGRKFLAGGDSRFGLPSYKEIRSLTLDDIRAYVIPSLSGGPMELSVVGDFDEEKVIGQCARYLGSLERKNVAQASPGREPAFPEGRRLELEVDTQIPKGLVMVSYPTADFWDISRTRRLSVLGAVFSDRLRESVREKLGAAYSPYAYNRPARAYPGYGTFQAVVSVDPDKTALVESEVKKISDGLVAEGVTEDELKRALDPILTGIKDMKRTNSYWLNSVLLGSMERPCRFEWSRTFSDDYKSITRDDVWKFAKQYLDNKKAAVVLVTPGKNGL